MAVLDRVDQINVRASQIDPAKLLLAVLALPLLILGWVAAKVWQVLWLVVSWSVAAVQVGWVEARKPSEDRQ
jgi:hypothetical protein